MDTRIQEFIAGKRIAIVGASQKDKNKFGNTAAAELKRRGYEVYLVHPQAENIQGMATYSSLDAVRDRVDGVFVSVSPAKGEGILREAAAVGISHIWIQQGGESPELTKLGEDLNLNLVTGKCILLYATPIRGFHIFHRIVAQLSGQL